ncbi:zinc ribbon domain-containing protein [Lentilactobacillus parafarraginis]|jgi:predicted amidophosphoribosyltransferase|uniref:Uncharacterized protein n=2 Tax=Lentilactobacillus parafarraginis TaxID=390842 RepID=A0A0R1YN90_9LACO|nr:zinc ribbon domain-containing protein [Lentilactobacillus parafarraginis]KRM43681.1 hypothetical protein FD47_GL001483 [Lentilactobacillus parafarraginis DSM 18390 = JCM 14109]TLQ18576.1 zinc ribbon domain-containing protein [Lentilactobacillus parafarraginis]
MASQKFAFCPYCGAKLTGNPTVCPNCHRQLPVETHEPKSAAPSMTKLFNNPYKEGMDRYREEKAPGKHPVKKSFWRRLMDKL